MSTEVGVQKVAWKWTYLYYNVTYKQVLDTYIPHENELSTATVTAKPIWKSMLVWLYYTVWVTVKPTYLNNDMHYIQLYAGKAM